MLKRVAWFGLVLSSFGMQAAFAYNPQDPIGWEHTTAFPSSITTNGGVYVSTYTFKNQTGYTLVHSLQVTPTASPSGEFTFTNNCSGQFLTNGATCTVTADLTPITNGTKTLQLLISGWSNNQVYVPQPAESVSASDNTGVSITGSVVTALPSSLQVNGTPGSFNLKFTNSGTSSATGVSVIAHAPGTLSYSTTCSSRGGTNTLAAGASCNVSGTYVPTSSTPSTQSVTAHFSYQQGSTVSTSTSTSVTTGGISTSATLSAVTQTSTNYPVSFTFINNYATAVSVGSSAFTYSNFSAPVLSGGCPTDSGTFSAGGTCTITGTFNKSSAGSYTVSATMNTTSVTPPVASASTTTTAPSTDSRTINVVNQCPFKVWYSLLGGNLKPSLSCQSNSDCPSGTLCDPNANGGTGYCFWISYPSTTNGGSPSTSLELAANTGTATVTIPLVAAATAASPGGNVFWNGGFAGRTGCTSTSCVTADCGSGTGVCPVGGGFKAPVTQVEVTLQTNNDFYDAEVINGFNIPVSFGPTGSQSGVTPNGYLCGTAGNNTATNGFTACDWNNAQTNMPTDTTNYYWVSAESNPQLCSSSSPTCSTSGYVCGIAQVPVNPGVAPPKISKQCGKFLGYMTADQACAYDIPNGSVNANTYFNCNVNIDNGQVSNALGCTGSYGGSCYAIGQPCCGCEDWPTVLGISIPTPISGQQCTTGRAYTPWVQNVSSNLIWLKKTCSNIYTYPYDDPTSSFQCSNGGTNNAINYTLTFCPGGNSGLTAASGITDGRSG